MIDPEFAFYGPMGYDVGNVIGNLIFAWANKRYTDEENQEFLEWIQSAIGETIDQFYKKLSRKFDEIVVFDLYCNQEFKNHYLQTVLSDSFGYAGTEIIRRVVGDAKVMEVTSVAKMDQRIPLERALIHIGISLIKERDQFQNGEDVLKMARTILK